MEEHKSPVCLLGLADASLASLSYRPLNEIKHTDIAQIARLQRLTRLELLRFRTQKPTPAHTLWSSGEDELPEKDVTPLHSLAIRELILIDCENVEVDLIVPGSFTELEKLHIEDWGESQWSWNEGPMRQLESRRRVGNADPLVTAAKLVAELPQLRRISGQSDFFDLVLCFSSWEEVYFLRECMIKNESRFRKHVKMWLRK